MELLSNKENAVPGSKRSGAVADFIPKRFVLFLALFFTLCLALIYWELSRNQEALIKRTALQHAEVYSAAIEKFRSLYTSEVVEPAQKSGLTITHDYRNREHAIPLPATLSLELARSLGEHGSGSKTLLYSPYPFPWREEEGGLADSFAREAWARLSKAPDEPFYRI